MTTVPSMVRAFSAWRMASTAAWSAAFSSPRPISREADSAAASVTRTASRARLRSIVVVSVMLKPPGVLLGVGGRLHRFRHPGVTRNGDTGSMASLQVFDAHHTRRVQNGGKTGHASD